MSKICMNCGAEMQDEHRVCSYCGTPYGQQSSLGGTPAAPNTNAYYEPMPAYPAPAPAPAKSSGAKIAVIIGILLAVIIVLGVVIALLVINKNDDNSNTASAATQSSQSNDAFTQPTLPDNAGNADAQYNSGQNTTEPAYDQNTLPPTQVTQQTTTTTTTSRAANSPVFTTAYATSSLAPDGNITYYPRNVLDRDPTTAWVEGVAGYGIGESITIMADSTQCVNGIDIYSGYLKNRTVLEKNAVPTKFSIEFSDGSIMVSQDFKSYGRSYVTADTTRDFAYITHDTIYFSYPVYTKSIKITILDYTDFSSKQDEDICITEIIAW